MKKILVLLSVFLLLSSALICRFVFAAQRKKEESIVEVKEEKKEGTKEEIVVKEETKEEEKTEEADTEGLYKMLDFDRRLILRVGIQDDWVCSIFNLAYARAILDEDYRSDPYDYYDGEGAVWRWADFEDIALSDPLDKVLQKAYDEIDAGRPVILFCSGNYAHIPDHEEYNRSTGDHYVLLIGFKEDADYKNLKASDFYAADPSRGYSDSKDTFMPWIVLTDEAPATIRGEYALYASVDTKKAVPTCSAYADRSTWDSDLKKEIHPEYLEENR